MMEMTDAEVRCYYRGLKPGVQNRIQILADLNGCGTIKIREILQGEASEMTRKPTVHVDHDSVLLMIKHGEDPHEIAKRMGCTANTIFAIRRKAGLAPESPKLKEHEARIRELFAAGKSDREIADAIGISSLTVGKWRQEIGLLRPRGGHKPHKADTVAGCDGPLPTGLAEAMSIAINTRPFAETIKALQGLALNPTITEPTYDELLAEIDHLERENKCLRCACIGARIDVDKLMEEART